MENKKIRKFNFKKFWKISGTIIVILAIITLILVIGTDASAKVIKDYGKVKDITYTIDETDYGYKITKNNDDDFRILQLTDIHIGGGVLSIRNDKMALITVADLVYATKPDLIIATGDIAYPVPVQSGTINNKVAAEIFADLMDKFEIPWTITFGNHDTEPYSLYKRDYLTKLYSQRKYCLLSRGPEDIKGYGNQIITLHNTDGSINTAIVQLDSNDYIEGKFGLNHYDKIHDEQVDWYKDNITKLSEKEGKTVPSLMFIHIPLQEYKEAYDLHLQGSPEAKLISGKRREPECHSELPSKMFDTIVELGSTKAVFAGHDHVNDYIIEYKGVTLVYGKSIDYLAYAWSGIVRKTEQRGGTVIDIKSDSTFEITSIRYSSLS